MVPNSANHNTYAYRHKLVASAANEPRDKPCSQHDPHRSDRFSSMDYAPAKSVAVRARHQKGRYHETDDPPRRTPVRI